MSIRTLVCIAIILALAFVVSYLAVPIICAAVGYYVARRIHRAIRALRTKTSTLRLK